MLRLALSGVVLLVSLLLVSPVAQAEGEVKPSNRSEAIKIIAGLRQIVTPQGIERLEPVEINGAKQWLSIRSRNPANPVILVVHGGPGWVAMPTSWYFAQGWDEYFTVVQWDQRGAGKSYDPALIDTLTVEQMQRDIDAVIAWVRAETQQDKIFLLGHSWGSLLGLDVARRHPEWLHAYVGAGQVVDMRESERRGWAWAMRKREAHQPTQERSKIMPVERVLYTAQARATGGRVGRANTPGRQLDVALTMPKELGGDGAPGANPEELFAAGYSACFLGAMTFVASKQKIKLAPDSAVEGRVGIGPIPTGFGIEVELRISMPGLEPDVAQDLIDKAHVVCPYSNATQGNINVTLTLV